MNEKHDERLVDLALKIHHFNQDVMELNIKYSEEIERLNNIIKQYDKVSFIHEMELQKRIDKAIEYIESRARKAGVRLMPREIELLEILKGD